jgi:hypothetical protein
VKPTWILAPFGLVPVKAPRSVNRGYLTVAPTRRQREWRRQKPLARRCARALHPQTVAEGKRTPVTEFWRGTGLSLAGAITQCQLGRFRNAFSTFNWVLNEEMGRPIAAALINVDPYNVRKLIRTV